MQGHPQLEFLMPTKVEFYTSNNGVDFELVAAIDNTVKAEDYEVQVKDFTANALRSNPSLLPQSQSLQFRGHSQRGIKAMVGRGFVFVG